MQGAELSLVHTLDLTAHTQGCRRTARKQTEWGRCWTGRCLAVGHSRGSWPSLERVVMVWEDFSEKMVPTTGTER